MLYLWKIRCFFSLANQGSSQPLLKELLRRLRSLSRPHDVEDGDRVLQCLLLLLAAFLPLLCRRAEAKAARCEDAELVLGLSLLLRPRREIILCLFDVGGSLLRLPLLGGLLFLLVLHVLVRGCLEAVVFLSASSSSFSVLLIV